MDMNVLLLFPSEEKSLRLSETLQRHDQHHGDGTAADNAEQPLHPVEEIESLYRKEQQIINEYYNQRVEHVRTHTDGSHRWFQVFSTVSRHEEFKKIRLQQSDGCHRCRRNTRRVGKHVDAKSQHEAPEHHRPAWVVSAEMEHHDDIQQGGGTIEQMDMVEHQSLHQHEHHEDAESF